MRNETGAAGRGTGCTPQAQARDVPPSPASVRRELQIFIWKVMIVIGAAAVVYAAAYAAQVLLLLFAGVLFAIFLVRLAGYIQRWTHLPRGAALALVLLCLVALNFAGGWMLSTMAIAEFGKLATTITHAYDALPQDIRSQISQGTDLSKWMDQLRSLLPPVLLGLTDGLIVIFSGVYLAVAPEVYQRGLILLVPPAGHERAREVLHVTGEALWLWLVGQFCAMVLVGTLTGLGLWLLGMPVPIQLGILAGVLEFVPYAGPVLAAAPAVLIALSQSPTQVIWVVGVYLVVQQVENHLIQPLVQRAVVDLPPVVTIGAIAAGGYLFGLLGVMIATPLAITIMSIVNMLYLADRLGEGRHFPPEDKVPESG